MAPANSLPLQHSLALQGKQPQHVRKNSPAQES
jgi:hypothetical protein